MRINQKRSLSGPLFNMSGQMHLADMARFNHINIAPSIVIVIMRLHIDVIEVQQNPAPRHVCQFIHERVFMHLIAFERQISRRVFNQHPPPQRFLRALNIARQLVETGLCIGQGKKIV